MKKVTIEVTVSDETNQNELKNWLKSCPFSFVGGQTIKWENIPNPEPPKEEAKATEAKAG